MAPCRLSSAHFMPDMAVPIVPLRAVLCRCRHKKPWRWLSASPWRGWRGKRVSLLAVSTIPTVMYGMTTAAATVKKAALGRKKSPPLAVKKQLLIGSIFTAHQKTPFQPSPSDSSSFLLCLSRLCSAPSPWGRLGWGFYSGWCAPLATL